MNGKLCESMSHYRSGYKSPYRDHLIKQLEAIQGELSDDSAHTYLEQSLSQELNLGNEKLLHTDCL